MIANEGLEWGHTCGRSGLGVVSIFDPCLAIGLGMETRGKAYSFMQRLTKLFPYLGHKLRTSVGDDIQGNAMKVENMVDEEVQSLPSCGKFR